MKMFHHSFIFKQLHCSQQSPLLSLSSIHTRFVSTISNKHQFTVDYLINSCGLSPESALKASNKIALKSSTGPDSILTLFKTYGFTQSHISKIITKRPSCLLANPEKTIKPKLDFFTTMGISVPNLGKLISKNSSILASNLEKKIVPCVNFLRTLHFTDTSISVVLSRSRLINAECAMRPNIKTLLDIGVPQSNIAKLIVLFPQDLNRKNDDFRKVAMQIEEMGLCPSRMGFLFCLHVLVSHKKSLWDAKMELYRSFGWSEDEVLSMFKQQPFVMSNSVEKIKLALDFLMNALKWSRGDIMKNSCVILYSLENRVIPRCHILQILFSKGLVKKTSMGSALRKTEKDFLEDYVIKYHHEVPELLNIYQTKMKSRSLLDGRKDGSQVKEI